MKIAKPQHPSAIIGDQELRIRYLKSPVTANSSSDHQQLCWNLQKAMSMSNHIGNSNSCNRDGASTNREEKKDGIASASPSISSFGSLMAENSTFAAQSNLPRLPIPTLEETLDKFPKVLEALQTDSQRQRTLQAVEEFRHGDGPKLQKLLLEYDAKGRQEGTVGSYVEEFWNESYLAPDQSVVLNLNPYFVLEVGPDRKVAKDQLRRAASLCYASVKLASLLKNETMAPDEFKGKKLCMDQFKALFGAARVPLPDKDEILIYPDSAHVAVMCCNQVFYFQALWPDGKLAVDETDIMDILKAVQKKARAMDPLESSKTALGVLTSLPRREWALARAEFVAAHPANGEALQILDSALFVLCLDDYTPENVDQKASNMLHGTYQLQMSSEDEQEHQVGTCCNRWYDKLQIIVCANGTAGVNFEHSAIDGHTALRYVSDIFAETVVNFAQSITRLIHNRRERDVPHVVHALVQRAASVLDDDGQPTLDVFPKQLILGDYMPRSVKERIFFAETALGDQIVSSETKVLEFKDWGKSFIVGNKFSPDSLVQMSMLLAYYQLYGKVVCQYEPVLTKHFYHGRTEAMRTATPQARELCLLWRKPDVTKEEKLEALRKATKEHSRLIKEASAGKGVDRHLFALRCIAEHSNLPIPNFFKSEAWETLNHTVLSTSNCGNPSLRLFGFGPVVHDGFGIGYIIKDHGIQYSVSSKHRQTERYVHTLRNVLKEMESMMTPVSSMKVRESLIKKRTKTTPIATTRKTAPAAAAAKDNAPAAAVALVMDDEEEGTYDDIYGESRVSNYQLQDSSGSGPPTPYLDDPFGHSFTRLSRRHYSSFRLTESQANIGEINWETDDEE